MLARSRPDNMTVATSINKCWRQVDPSTPWSWRLLIKVYVNIQTTKCGSTFSLLAAKMIRQRNNGGLRIRYLAFAIANEARNMTENALSILIVIFSVQLEQTEISERKPFIFQHGNSTYNFILYNSCSMHNCIKTYNKEKYFLMAVLLNIFGTLELLFPISKKEFVLVLFQFLKAQKMNVVNFLLRSKIHHSCCLLICKMSRCFVPKWIWIIQITGS